MSVAAGGYEGRLEQASGELARLVRRLRSLSPQAWTSRRARVQAALARLAELAGKAEGRQVPPLPSVADHALADAAAVVGGDGLDALTTNPDDELLAALVAVIGEALEGSR